MNGKIGGMTMSKISVSRVLRSGLRRPAEVEVWGSLPGICGCFDRKGDRCGHTIGLCLAGGADIRMSNTEAVRLALELMSAVGSSGSDISGLDEVVYALNKMWKNLREWEKAQKGSV